jgi:hypothetical protein
LLDLSRTREQVRALNPAADVDRIAVGQRLWLVQYRRDMTLAEIQKVRWRCLSPTLGGVSSARVGGERARCRLRRACGGSAEPLSARGGGGGGAQLNPSLEDVDAVSAPVGSTLRLHPSLAHTGQV